MCDMNAVETHVRALPGAGDGSMAVVKAGTDAFVVVPSILSSVVILLVAIAAGFAFYNGRSKPPPDLH